MEKIKRITLAGWIERQKILRYLFSGGTAFGVDFFFLYIFTEWIGLHYLISVVIAFLVAVVVSFILQKFWTFKNNSKTDLRRQATIYITVAIINTGLNTLLVYLFVEYIGLHYLFGQFFSSGLIAFESFFVYQIFIFHDRNI
ncbi:MAG: GtrA family protein [Patescibacteria group bacterium]